ncbi:MAG: MMPL family transporter [Dermatophilaceae bacterium]
MQKPTTPSPVTWRVLGGALVVLILWISVGGVGGQLVGKLSQLQKNDTASFLPDSAESTRVAEAVGDFSDRTTLPLIIVAERATGLVPDDVATAQRLAGDLPALTFQLSGTRTVADYLTTPRLTAVPSKDGQAVLLVVPLDSAKVAQVTGGEESALKPLAEAVQQAVDRDLRATGLRAYVTGPAGFIVDLTTAFAGIDGLLILVALGVVLVILLVVYRSPILPFAVLLTAVFGLSAAGFLVYQLADAGAVTVSGQSQGILSILVVGAATDYSLLMVSRYKEELHDVESTWQALKTAWRATVEPIAASALTVILGLMALTLGDLKGTSSLGPVGAVGILGAFLAAITLLPALLVLGRRWIFWPTVPRPDHRHAANVLSNKLGWRRVAELVGARPRVTWLCTVGALLVAAAFLPTLKADGIAQSDIFRTTVDSVEGQSVLAAHFDAGSGSPVQVLAPQSRGQEVVARLAAEEGVSDPYVTTQGGAQRAPGAPPAAATVVDGRVLVQATLTEAADSPAAIDVLERVRTDLHAIDPAVLVGGQTAQSLDTRIAADRDLLVVAPTITGVVFLVLCLLLRALVAPLLLVLANILSFAATMGISAIVFNHVIGFTGGDPTTILYGFVFLVALGVDYSIFLMSRAREETRVRGPRDGVLRALAVTGGVITSAGIVLAATFGALTVIPLVFIAQISFIVAFGVLLDTFVVRSLLVPALAVDLGRRTWWPSRLSAPAAARHRRRPPKRLGRSEIRGEPRAENRHLAGG